jgi:hypothetical protein
MWSFLSSDTVNATNDTKETLVKVNLSARLATVRQPGLAPVVTLPQITVQSAVNVTSFSIAVYVMFQTAVRKLPEVTFCSISELL